MVEMTDRVRLLGDPTEIDNQRAKRQVAEHATQLEVAVPYDRLAVDALAVLAGALRDPGIQNILRRKREKPDDYVGTVLELTNACLDRAVTSQGVQIDQAAEHLPTQLAQVIEGVVDDRVWGVNYG